MKQLLLILFLFASASVFGQTAISSIETDTTYIQGVLNGRNVLMKATEFLAGGGGVDGLGAPHQATASLNMDNNEIDSVSILTMYNTDADSDTWSILEKGTTGDFWIQSSETGTADLSITTAGVVTFGGTTFPSATGTNGQVLTADGAGSATWATPSGGGGSGSTLYYFGGYSTSTAALTQDVWIDVPINVETVENASFTHAADSAFVTLDSAGLYMISANVHFDRGTNRLDGSIRIQRDTGAGFVDLPGGMGYGSIAGDPFASVAIDTRAEAIPDVIYNASAGDKIKIQAYADTLSDWTLASGSTLTIVRIE